MAIRNRSEKYQWSILEIVFSHEMMGSFSNAESLSDRLNPYHYNEDVMDLEDELKHEFWRIVKQLTPRQQQVIKLCADGYTQMEIARRLKVNQSSITKSLHGNIDYKKGRRIYGGAAKKLIKIIENDEKIKSILNKIAELREAKW